MRAVEREPLRARRRIWMFTAGVTLAIAVSAVLSTFPLLSARSESHQVRRDDAALARVVDLRTTLAEWQLYIEQRIPRFSTTAAAIDPLDLAEGSRLDALLTDRGRAAVGVLHEVGLPGNARSVDAANTALLNAIAGLAPLTAGRPTAVIVKAVANERKAFDRAWASASSAAAGLGALGRRDMSESIAHLDQGRKTLLTADAVAGAIALITALVFGRRARRREIAERITSRRRTFEAMMQHALEMSKSESDVYVILNEALQASVPDLQVEMLVADSSRAHFHQTLTTGAGAGEEPRAGCGVISPLDCPATRRGHTLVFPSSRALDACPHLKGRTSGECSAVCVAISLTGKTVGVLHATGPDEVAAPESDVRYLEITSRRASERIAMLRAFEKSEAQARSDPLTGMWNRRSIENRIRDLQRDGIPYALAYGDLDHFKDLNDTHGHDAGDQALRLFSRVLRESIRPNDMAARYGGEEFVIVLPDCSQETATMVLERLRERLALTLANARVPAFTVSFGLASSTDALTFDEVVATADRALLRAKGAGRNRVVTSEQPDALRPA